MSWRWQCHLISPRRYCDGGRPGVNGTARGMTEGERGWRAVTGVAELVMPGRSLANPPMDAVPEPGPGGCSGMQSGFFRYIHDQVK
ncbi:hypothetical protein STRIP9103_07882 [Streptomyces ipomoeae 91-03]|uniref:Uncharacterized protein n=1 Tax=Streptomyces ipomoeae 91-03 TaxID=698759 RepID=L1L2T6_9ACTN|nr:hypothetical protein STRIP9103_07882 [Streptomyces ipomoeae 91-03]